MLALAQVECQPSDDQVCLLQFMERAVRGQLSTEEELDFPHHGDCGECPGYPVVVTVNDGTCHATGVQVFAPDNITAIAEFFGDNVAMRALNFYLKGDVLDTPIIDPTVEQHKFYLGTSEIRVEGVDLSENMKSCIRTVKVTDTQPPRFQVHPGDVDESITIDFEEDSCSISASEAFSEYESNGWVSAAVDNCDGDVEIVKRVEYCTEATVCELIYDSATSEIFPTLNGPTAEEGGYPLYKMTYVAIDDAMTDAFPSASALESKHTFTVHLIDEIKPYGFEGCPNETIQVIIEAHETEGYVDWTPPHVVGDNCDAFVPVPEAVEQSTPPKAPGMYPVGAHSASYAFSDGSGNGYGEECTFHFEVIQKAHLVELTCPPNVELDTVRDGDFALVTWDPPVAMQGPVQLDQSHISYPQGVEQGLPFPFGTTEITVRAEGEVTGTRVEESERSDECIFTVTVTDPQKPMAIGEKYRCADPDSSDVVPYGICNGIDLQVTLHGTYRDSYGYDVIGVTPVSSLSCCTSEDNVEHACVQLSDQEKISYCVPA